jgi:TrmH family RNA methyltransferase
MNPLEHVRIVLVEPRVGGNIGAITRAMNNCGITDLALVNPPSTIDWNEAEQRACNAKAQLEERKTFPTLQEAIADCTLVAGTSARTGFYRAQSVSPEELAPLAIQSAQHYPVALVFGREDKGLFNEEIALCTHLIHIPSSDLYTSINLSHAVMICTYELFKQANVFIPSEEKAEDANAELRERMFALWREMMIKTEFTQPQKIDHMMMGLRRIFLRGKLTVPDTKILMGLAKQSLYVADKLEKTTQDRTTE